MMLHVMLLRKITCYGGDERPADVADVGSLAVHLLHHLAASPQSTEEPLVRDPGQYRLTRYIGTRALPFSCDATAIRKCGNPLNQ